MLWTDCICQLLDGTECNATEALMIHFCAFMLLYSGVLSIVLVMTNKENPAFLKRLAFHMQYGLTIFLGSMITMTPTGVEPTWWHICDYVSFFIMFALLAMYTSSDLAPLGIQQSLWDGHGMKPKSLLCLIAFIMIAKLLTVPDFFPLSSFISDVDSITLRAETFYSFCLCLTLGLWFILIVPILYGDAKDQFNTVIVVAMVEFVGGAITVWGFWNLFGSEWYTAMVVAVVVFVLLLVLALIGGYRDLKRENYNALPTDLAV
jgi:hypothetical protein